MPAAIDFNISVPSLVMRMLLNFPIGKHRGKTSITALQQIAPVLPGVGIEQLLQVPSLFPPTRLIPLIAIGKQGMRLKPPSPQR